MPVISERLRLARNWRGIARKAESLRIELEELKTDYVPPQKQTGWQNRAKLISDLVQKNAIKTFKQIAPVTADLALAIEHHLQTKPAETAYSAINTMRYPVVARNRSAAIRLLRHVAFYSEMYAAKLSGSAEKKSLDAAELIKAAADAVDELRRRQIQVDAKQALVETKPALLYTAVHELMENSRKAVLARFGEKANLVGAINASARTTPTGILIKIEDNGIGFEDARKLESGISDWKGYKFDSSGFGFKTLVKENLQQIGATLKTKSTPGKGATFEIFVPYKKTNKTKA